MKMLATCNRNAQRGEGNLKFIVMLLVLAYLGYCGIQDVPVYFSVMNLKHETDEFARVAAVEGMSENRMKDRATKLRQDYSLADGDITWTRDGKNVVVKISTTKQLDFLFTTYQWNIAHEARGQGL
jgi:apolipoprotein N-acyltransferase